ncbi:MAG: MAGE family-domain-containing protein [Benjaminiella poitrasii]|nr:MAG: MAGE family-domain-containing protein [Benjaminiella poitrasii]
MSLQKGKRPLRDDSDDDYLSQDSSQIASQKARISNHSTIDWEEEEIQRKVKDVVRYALSCEFKRKTIKREDLNKVIGKDKRTTAEVIRLAKDKLRHIFGFELVELPSLKDKFNPTQTQQLSTQQYDGGSTQGQRKGISTGAFIVRSILKDEYRTPEIITRSSEDYKLMGILYVILGLIFLNGQTMISSELYGHLDRMKLTKRNVEFEDRDKLLDSFVRSGYLKKVQLSNESESEEIEYNFTWGQRSIVELGHAGVIAFLTSFYDVDEEEMKSIERKMWTQAGYQIRN